MHFLCNLLGQIPMGSAEMVAAAIGTIFARPDAQHLTEELLASTAFPVSHWKKIWSTNPLERLNKEIKRRTDVAGVFPNPAALLLLAGAVLVEAHSCGFAHEKATVRHRVDPLDLINAGWLEPGTALVPGVASICSSRQRCSRTVESMSPARYM